MFLSSKWLWSVDYDTIDGTKRWLYQKKKLDSYHSQLWWVNHHSILIITHKMPHAQTSLFSLSLWGRNERRKFLTTLILWVELPRESSWANYCSSWITFQVLERWWIDLLSQFLSFIHSLPFTPLFLTKKISYTWRLVCSEAILLTPLSFSSKLIFSPFSPISPDFSLSPDFPSN